MIVCMVNASFPGWLRRQLDRREWTQADFARRLDLSPAVVSRWITGRRIPDPRYCDLIADALGVDLDLVLFHAGHRPLTDPPPPDDPRADLHGLVDRINWANAPGGYEVVTTALRSIIKEQRGEYK